MKNLQKYDRCDDDQRKVSVQVEQDVDKRELLLVPDSLDFVG